jgi:hypothetical protein
MNPNIPQSFVFIPKKNAYLQTKVEHGTTVFIQVLDKVNVHQWEYQKTVANATHADNICARWSKGTRYHATWSSIPLLKLDPPAYELERIYHGFDFAEEVRPDPHQKDYVVTDPDSFWLGLDDDPKVRITAHNIMTHNEFCMTAENSVHAARLIEVWSTKDGGTWELSSEFVE